jgi:hypothetical protein
MSSFTDLTVKNTFISFLCIRVVRVFATQRILILTSLLIQVQLRSREGFTHPNIAILISRSYFTQANMAQQGKQMRISIRKWLAYHLVRLVKRANRNRYAVDYEMFSKW